MWFQRKLSTLLLATIALWYSASSQYSVSQAEPPHAILTKLFPPVYSHVVQEATIAGDVKLAVTVHPDGTIESVTSISGNPMLAKPLSTAQNSPSSSVVGAAHRTAVYI
jgi:outer membrane biosynthesis protein TonB